jgi:hypothetical protein
MNEPDPNALTETHDPALNGAMEAFDNVSDAVAVRALGVAILRKGQITPMDLRTAVFQVSGLVNVK